MITPNYEINQESLKKLIKKLDASIKDSVIKESLNTSAALLVGWSKKNRLTGPRPRFLGVVTGRLRSSIAFSPTVKEGDTYFSKIGTNVVYGRTHEFGDVRRNIPARPFLRPSIESPENRKAILNIITKRINEELAKK